MRRAIRFAIISPALCLECPDIGGRGVIAGDSKDFVECRREMCDNHRRGGLPLPPPLPDVPPFELPAPDSTQPLAPEREPE